MKTLTAVVLLLLLSLAVSAQEPSFKLAELNWFAGCWQSARAGQTAVSTERWAPPAGGMMIGFSQTVKNGATVEFEFLRLAQDGANVFYIAHPAENKADTAFKLIRLENRAATFENPTHDFPQRIVYRRRGAKMFARIEGNNNGKAMGIDYPMTKIKCE